MTYPLIIRQMIWAICPHRTWSTAYTDQNTGQALIFIIKDSLWFGNKLPNSLITWISCNMWASPFRTTLSIRGSRLQFRIKRKMCHYCLMVLIYFQTTTPTQSELDNCPHIVLTLDTEWNPNTVQLATLQSANAEDVFLDGFGGMEPGLLQISSIYIFEEMAKNMQDQRKVSAFDVVKRKTFVSKDRHPAVTKETLSERWKILALIKQSRHYKWQRNKEWDQQNSCRWVDGTGPIGCISKRSYEIKGSMLTPCLAVVSWYPITRVPKSLRTNRSTWKHIRWSQRRRREKPCGSLYEITVFLSC